MFASRVCLNAFFENILPRRTNRARGIFSNEDQMCWNWPLATSFLCQAKWSNIRAAIFRVWSVGIVAVESKASASAVFRQQILQVWPIARSGRKSTACALCFWSSAPGWVLIGSRRKNMKVCWTILIRRQTVWSVRSRSLSILMRVMLAWRLQRCNHSATTEVLRPRPVPGSRIGICKTKIPFNWAKI